MLVFHPAGVAHSETFDESHVASFNVEIGPEWTQRMKEFGVQLDQPAEFDGGEVATLALRMLDELSANDPESGHRSSYLGDSRRIRRRASWRRKQPAAMAQ
jgi:hypothetical protein